MVAIRLFGKEKSGSDGLGSSSIDLEEEGLIQHNLHLNLDEVLLRPGLESLEFLSLLKERVPCCKQLFSRLQFRFTNGDYTVKNNLAQVTKFSFTILLTLCNPCKP